MTSAVIDTILPTVGRPSLLRALASIQAQTSPPHHLWIVDDSPVGGVEGLLREFPMEKGWFTVLSGPRRGPGAARNLALGHAEAPWVAFLDDDDAWFPHHLASLAAALSPSVALVGADARLANGSRYRESFSAELPRHGGVLRPLLSLLREGSFLCTSATMGNRRAIHEAGGFGESRPRSEDYDLWLRMAKRGGEILLVEEAGAMYQPGEDSLSHDLLHLHGDTCLTLEEFLSGSALTVREIFAIRTRMSHLHGVRACLLVDEGAASALPEALSALRCLPTPMAAWALARAAVARWQTG